MKSKTKLFIFIFAIFSFAVFYFLSRSSCAGGLVPCTNDCNLCYLIVGISNIVQYLTGALLTAAFLLGITIAGLSYMVSGAFPKALNFAKTAFSSSLKGFVLALIAWLIINGIMNIVGYKHPYGGKWYQFECSDGGTNNNGTCDAKNKKLESVTIQCAEQKDTLANNGSGFFVVLDTLSGNEKGKTKQLKAVGKYSCDGTASEEDITSQVEWKASDETQVKVAKGLVQAVGTSIGSSQNTPYVEAKFQDKNSNQAKVYINSCPNTMTAEAETKNKFSFSENNLGIPKARAQTTPSANDSWIYQPEGDNNTDCKSCGETNTCHFVAGTENAPFIFIFIRRKEYDPSETNGAKKNPPCDGNFTAPLETQKFGEQIKEVSKQLQFAPKEAQSKIGIYWSSVIGKSDSSCPQGKNMTSYGYVYEGVSDDAGKVNNNAYYCSGAFQKSVAAFAHEQIGHALGHLNDEYIFSQPYDYKNSILVNNCTLTQNCPKWKSLGGACIKGCIDGEKLYRSTENSIMNDDSIANSFGSVNDALIIDHVNNWEYGGDFSSCMFESLKQSISPDEGKKDCFPSVAPDAM